MKNMKGVTDIKFIFTGDIHLSKYSNDKINSESNLPERLHDINMVLYQMANYAVKNSIENIVISGDIFHNKSIIHSLAMNLFLFFIRSYKNLNFIIIDGNHDLSGKGADVVSALSCLDSESNVTRISQPTKIDSIMYIPYTYDMIDIIKNNTGDYLISHFGLNEGVLNSGISVVSDVKLSDLIGRYGTVLLSHYHKSQEILRDDIRLYYVGSLIQLDWGERDDNKRFLVVDTETGEIESILTHGYKKHYEFSVTVLNREEILREARQLKEQGHHINLVKTDNDVIVDDIKNEFNIVDKTIRDITNRGLTTGMSTEEKLKKYLEIKEISEDQLNDYLSIGFEIINSCVEEE